MLPESSIQGHLFIKVRNCCLNLFTAANVTRAAVMDWGSLCTAWGCPCWEVAQMWVLVHPPRGCKHRSGLPGFSPVEQRLLGLHDAPLALAGGHLAPSQAVTPTAFPLRSSFSPWYRGPCALVRGWGGIWTPPPCESDGTEGRGEFLKSFLVVSRAAGMAGQEEAFPLAETNRESQTLRHPGCRFRTQT